MKELRFLYHIAARRIQFGVRQKLFICSPGNICKSSSTRGSTRPVKSGLTLSKSYNNNNNNNNNNRMMSSLTTNGPNHTDLAPRNDRTTVQSTSQTSYLGDATPDGVGCALCVSRNRSEQQWPSPPSGHSPQRTYVLDCTHDHR